MPVLVEPSFHVATLTVDAMLASMAAVVARPGVRAFPKDVDWQELERVARINKLLVPVQRGLDRLAVAASPTFRQTALAYRGEALRVNSANLATIGKLVTAFDRAKIAFAVFKGPLQQQTLWGDHFTRPSGDVDVLTSAGQFDAAVRVLLDLGYELPAECATPWWRYFLGEQHLFTPDSRLSVVDLHHRVQQPGCPAPRHLADYVRRAERVPLGRVMVPTLPRIDAALLSSISLVKALFHREPAAGYVVDLALAAAQMPDADRAALTVLARRQRMTATLSFALRCVDRLLGPGAPNGLPEAANRSVVDDDLARLVITPWQDDLDWPRRRQILWELCDGGPARKLATYLHETSWALAGEASHRLWQSKASRQPEAAPAS